MLPSGAAGDREVQQATERCSNTLAGGRNKTCSATARAAPKNRGHRETRLIAESCSGSPGDTEVKLATERCSGGTGGSDVQQDTERCARSQ